MKGQYIFYHWSITMYTCLSWSWHHILSGTISCFFFCCLIITRLKVKVKVKTKHFVNNLLSGEAFHGPNGAPPQETCPGPSQRPEWPPGNSWKTCSQPTPQDSYYSNLEVSFSKRINNPLILKFFFIEVFVCVSMSFCLSVMLGLSDFYQQLEDCVLNGIWRKVPIKK